MDLKIPKHFLTRNVFQSNRESSLEGNSSFCRNDKENPFADTFLNHTDPLCKLNLRETSDFVKAFPMAKNSSETRGFLETSTQKRREAVGSVAQRRLEAPSTPGRPVFSFNGVVSEATRSPIGCCPRKSFPSKWDDAEKWLTNSSCHESPAPLIKALEPPKICKQILVSQKKTEVFEEKFRVTDEKFSSSSGSRSSDPNSAFQGVSSDVLLKDKFTDNVEPIWPNFRCKEGGFLFKNSVCGPMKDACTEVVAEVQHRDFGTEMTPLGSSRTSRCHTPLQSYSPARHNTPAAVSGPLGNSISGTGLDISEVQDCHFAKLELGTQFQTVDRSASNWSTREEEEEEISKSLRHCETGICRKSVAESRASIWEDEQRTKCCIRYQREEAKVQAWVNLQSAKAEAQSRKLEVKIQKLRSNLEEKLMNRMAVVHRKAEEWRVAAQLQHTQQMLKTSEEAQKLKNQNSFFSDKSLCGCFPCNNHP